MTTTRSQAAAAAAAQEHDAEPPAQTTTKKRKTSKARAKPPAKKAHKAKATDDTSKANASHEGPTIERGHIYFFFRPRVEMDEAHSLDDVRSFHMLLLPRPPAFSMAETETSNDTKAEEVDSTEMTVLEPGADAVPASQPLDATHKQPYRLVTVGKKKLPDPDHGGAGKGRKETFWATVTKVGDDLQALETALAEKTYETKTRGTRHVAPARITGRGGYAIVANNPRVPSDKSTHLGYHISHPAELGAVQEDLGLEIASSFVIQVKNPLAPAMAPGQSNAKGAQYPDHIMSSVFGKGSKGRESYGLRFAPCETSELLDHEGAQLLLIAARGGEVGLEESLGEHRGEALQKLQAEESQQSIDDVFSELGLDKEVFTMESIKGEWI